LRAAAAEVELGYGRVVEQLGPAAVEPVTSARDGRLEGVRLVVVALLRVPVSVVAD
jgi:hypothetical protein